MKNQLPEEFDFQREVLPVLVVGLMLNLVGRYFAETQLKFTALSPDMPVFLFLDLIGTAFAAILIGPWWAATVGILASAIDGLQYQAYFPFGTTSIVIALVWGYMARLPWMRKALVPSTDKKAVALRDGFYAYLALVVAGAVAGDLVSAVTKVVLYSRMGLPLDLGKIFYRHALDIARGLNLPHPGIVSLLGADFFREFLDKSVTVAAALVFVLLIGFIPRGQGRGTLPKGEVKIWNEFKTDAHSIVLFAAMYAAFLFMAKLGRPVIHYSGAPKQIQWLGDTTVLLLLYVPICLSVIAFLLLSFDEGSELGHALDTDRRIRHTLYRRLLSRPEFSVHELERSEWFRLMKQESVYGLLGTVVLWRQHNQSVGGSVAPIFIYFGVTAVFAAVFFQERRQFSKRWERARKCLDRIHGWMLINRTPVSPEKVLCVLADVLQKDLFMTAEYPSRGTDIWFLPCILLANSPSVRDFAERKDSDRVLLVVPNGAGDLTENVCADIRKSMDVCGCETAIVLTTTPEIIEQRVYEWLRAMQADGREVILMGWEDAEAAVVAGTRKEDIGEALIRCRLRIMEELARRGEADCGSVPSSAESLIRRSLRGVQYLLQTLPPHSAVFDLGAGRGRHTLAAAKLGHRVLSVEQKCELHRELESVLKQLHHHEVTARCGDYRKLTSSEIGPADLVILTGMLQHDHSREELAANLEKIRDFLAYANSALYIEMLFDMKFDGVPPQDGRYPWSQAEFEEFLAGEFDASHWRIERLRGPYYRCQVFTNGPRSFLPPARKIESVSAEYLLVHSPVSKTAAAEE